MKRCVLGSVFFVLACSGTSRDDRTPITTPAAPPAPVAEPAPGDGGTIVSPPPDPEGPPDVPHGAVRAQDQTLFAQPARLPDAGVSIARQDGGVDAGRPGSRDASVDAGARGRDARVAGDAGPR